jgi:hypothetical protein
MSNGGLLLFAGVGKERRRNAKWRLDLGVFYCSTGCFFSKPHEKAVQCILIN